MSTKYKATTTEEAYFITITTVGWIDVFTRLNQKYNIINALNYCQKNKGLEIYAYVIMSNHLHLLCKATNGFVLSDVTPMARICLVTDSADLQSVPTK